MDIELIRDAIKRIAPDRNDADLDRFASSFVTHFQLHSAARLATSRRGSILAAKELVKIDAKIIKLAEAIAALPPDAVLALEGNSHDGNSMLKQLASFNESVAAAHNALVKMPEVSAKMGRPSDRVVEAVARYAATIFEKLSGERASRVTDPETGAPIGHFDAFLTAIFDGLDIGASADSAIRRLMARTTEK